MRPLGATPARRQPRLNDRSRFSEETYAGAHANGREAPKPAPHLNQMHNNLIAQTTGVAGLNGGGAPVDDAEVESPARSEATSLTVHVSEVSQRPVHWSG